MDLTENKLVDDLVCGICLDKPYIPYTLPCKHTFCYLDLKQAAETGGMLCPLCRAKIPSFILEEAEISDEVVALEEKAGKWLYSGRMNGWWFYDPETDKIIETSYKTFKNGGVPTVIIDILGRAYTIDFNNMEQRAPGGMIRRIKRAENAKGEIIKGLAGLRIVPEKDLAPVPTVEYSDPNVYTFNPNVWQN